MNDQDEGEKMITIKSSKEIELMKEAGRIVALTQKAIEAVN